MLQRGYGANVIQCGEVYDECYIKAVQTQKENGYTFIHPFDDEAGYSRTGNYRVGNTRRYR